MGKDMAPRVEVEAVVFDLDGTLIDSVDPYCRVLEEAFRKLGLPAVSRRRILAAATNGDFDWGYVLPKDSEYSREELIERIGPVARGIYKQIFRQGLHLVPGADRVVRKIADSGMKTGIVTSTPKFLLDDKLHPVEEAGLIPCFDLIMSSDDAPRKKPAPDPLVECARRLSLDTRRCVYVGDTRIDIRAGKGAGMKTVGVLTGFEGAEALGLERPDAIVDSVNDLCGLLGEF